MRSYYLTLDEPIVKRIAATVRYTGRKFQAFPVEEVKLSDTEWSGGSRTTYAAVRLSDGAVMPLTQAGQFMSAEGRKIIMTPGIAIVGHVMFMGKDHGLYIYVHPQDIAPMLESHKELSWEHKVVLTATISLKSSYAGISNYRYIEAHRTTGITKDEWEKAKSELTSLGLLDARGAITVKGKNSISSIAVSSDLYRLKRP